VQEEIVPFDVRVTRVQGRNKLMAASSEAVCQAKRHMRDVERKGCSEITGCYRSYRCGPE
jgi:hypothetical protein